MVASFEPCRSTSPLGKWNSVSGADGNADGNPAGHKSESGENPHRPDDSRCVENLLAGSLMNEGCDFAPEVGANHGSDVLVLQHDEPVVFEYRSVGGLYIADVGIDTIRIERCRNRTCGRQFVGEDVILNLATDHSAIAQGDRLTPPASASPCARLP